MTADAAAPCRDALPSWHGAAFAGRGWGGLDWWVGGVGWGGWGAYVGIQE